MRREIDSGGAVSGRCHRRYGAGVMVAMARSMQLARGVVGCGTSHACCAATRQPKAAAVRARAGLPPNAQAEVVTGARHGPSLEQTEPVNALVNAFIAAASENKARR